MSCSTFTRREWWDLLGQFGDPVTRVVTPEQACAFRAELKRRGWYMTTGETS
jgi:hypothetical protein